MILELIIGASIALVSVIIGAAIATMNIEDDEDEK